MIALINNLATATGAGVAVAQHGSLVAPAQLVIATFVVAVLMMAVMVAFVVVVRVQL